MDSFKVLVPFLPLPPYTLLIHGGEWLGLELGSFTRVEVRGKSPCSLDGCLSASASHTSKYNLHPTFLCHPFARLFGYGASENGCTAQAGEPLRCQRPLTHAFSVGLGCWNAAKRRGRFSVRRTDASLIHRSWNHWIRGSVPGF